MPKISVVIPAKNRRDDLIRALNSVFNQSETDLEVIVVDDGSTDNTLEVLNTTYPQVKFIQNKVSAGGAIARNQGAELASGSYVAFLDSDDEWLPHHLEDQQKILTAQQVDCVVGSFYLNRLGKKVRPVFGPLGSSYIGDWILGSGGGDARTSGLFVKKSVFQDVKFDPHLKKYQDWDLVMRLHKSYSIAINDNPTVVIHVDGPDRMSNSYDLESFQYFLNQHYRNISRQSQVRFVSMNIIKVISAKAKQTDIKHLKQIVKGKPRNTYAKMFIIAPILFSRLIYFYRKFKWKYF